MVRGRRARCGPAHCSFPRALPAPPCSFANPLASVGCLRSLSSSKARGHLCVAGLLATSLLEFRGNFCPWNSSPSLQASCKVIFARWFKATLRHRVQGNYSSCSEFKDTFLPGIWDSEDSSRRTPVGDLWLRAAKFLVALHRVSAGWRLFLKATELNCLSSTCGRRWGELLGSPEFIELLGSGRQDVGGETDPEIP